MWISISPDGTADRHGVETPAGTRFHWFKAHTTLNGTLASPVAVLAIKVPGHKYWQGLYMDRGYAGAEVELYRVESIEEHENGALTCKVAELSAVPVKGETFNGPALAALFAATEAVRREVAPAPAPARLAPAGACLWVMTLPDGYRLRVGRTSIGLPVYDVHTEDGRTTVTYWLGQVTRRTAGEGPTEVTDQRERRRIVATINAGLRLLGQPELTYAAETNEDARRAFMDALHGRS